jgi:hypothetical protein
MIFKIISEYVLRNCLSEIAKLPYEQYEVHIKPVKRSNQANALYWTWLKVIGDELGYTSDELHEAFKRQFIGVDEGIDIFGNAYVKPKSSAKLSKKEFNDYMMKVEIFVTLQGITLPQPDYFGLDLS